MKKNILLIIIIAFASCGFFNTELNEKGIEYIKSQGLLDDDENIIWYVSLLDVKSSGNFLTNKRISSYWLDGSTKDNNYKHFVYLKEIDSITLEDLSQTLTYSSYINVYSKGKNFKVYLDNDSIKTRDYFEKVKLELEKVDNDQK